MKTKRERFESVASSRVQKVLDNLELLAKCSNTRNYQYNEEDVNKMFKAVRDKLKFTEHQFSQGLDKKKDKFSF